MDYFSELLSSYDKLKKRTFKLIYIAEGAKKEAKKKEDGRASQEDVDISADKEAEGKAQEVVNAGKTQQHDPAMQVKGGEPYAYLTAITTKPGGNVQKINLVGGPVGAGRPQPIANAGGVPDVTSRAWKMLVNYFKDGDADRQEVGAQNQDDALLLQQQEAELLQQQQAQLDKKLRTVGGYFELQGTDPGKAVIASLQDQVDMLHDFCSMITKDANVDDSAKRFCGNKALTYIVAGKNNKGLEYKLATATAREITNHETGETKTISDDPGLVLQATEAHQFLLGFLTPGANQEGKCEELPKRIGTYGDKLILFGTDRTDDGLPEKGIAIGQNQLQKLALKKAGELCGEEAIAGLTKLIDKVSEKKKPAQNAVKGDWFEAVVQYAVQMTAGDVNAGDKLVQEIGKNRALLREIVGKMDENKGKELGEMLTEEQQQALLALVDPEDGDLSPLYQRIVRELRTIKPFIGFMDADDVWGTGGISQTGNRADVKFLYNDCAKAERKAAVMGSAVEKKEDGSYKKHEGKCVVGVGLKRYVKLAPAKFGEIKNFHRMEQLLLGTIKMDHRIAPGFLKSIQDRQFGDAVEGEDGSWQSDRWDNFESFATTLHQDIEDRTRSFVEDTTYIDDDGSIKSQTTTGVVAMMVGVLRKLLSPEKIHGSMLGNAFFKQSSEKNADSEWDYTAKDFEGDGPIAADNRHRARESVARLSRFNRLRQSIEGPDLVGPSPEDWDASNDGLTPVERQQAAKDYIIRSALICGSNIEDMTQTVVLDDGEVLNIPHNLLFDMMTKANNDPESDEPTFKFNESSVDITVTGEDGEPYTITYSQVGQPPTEGRKKGKPAEGGKPAVPPVLRDTRSYLMVETKTQRLLASATDRKMYPPQQQNNSTFNEYVKGHIKLLETFITQTT